MTVRTLVAPTPVVSAEASLTYPRKRRVTKAQRARHDRWLQDRHEAASRAWDRGLAGARSMELNSSFCAR